MLNNSSSPTQRITSGALRYIHHQLQHWASVCYVMNVALDRWRAFCSGLHSFKCATEVQFMFDPPTRQHFYPQYLRYYKAPCVYQTIYLAPTFTRGTLQYFIRWHIHFHCIVHSAYGIVIGSRAYNQFIAKDDKYLYDSLNWAQKADVHAPFMQGKTDIIWPLALE